MKKVLIVDDAEEFRFILKETLELWGYSPLEAADGQSAMRVVQEQSPDTVILDLVMPGMDGIEVLKEIRRTTSCLPVIILTGQGDISIAVTAMKMGAYGFLTKPPKFSELLAVIKEATEIDRNCSLTLREKETLELVKVGKSNSEIAELIGVSENTVRAHLKKIFWKLGVSSKAHAVSAAYESGFFQAMSRRVY